MLIRNLKSTDAPAIRSLHEQFGSYPLPDFNHPSYITQVIEEDDKVNGLGALKLTSEAILLIDHSLSTGSRIEMIEKIIINGIMQCQKYGINEMHAFLTGPAANATARLLKQKHGFEDIVGTPLVLRF